MSLPLSSPADGFWLNDPTHRAYLVRDAKRQLDFFDASLGESGGLATLDFAGKPLSGPQELITTTRLVHSYGLAQIAGRPDHAGIIDRGMSDLWNRHRDTRYGGYAWGVGQNGIVDGVKLAYGHVFVLLAASTAKQAGHPDADRLLADVAEALDRYFWDDQAGLFRDEFTREWQPFSSYRGMNANMHAVEAMLTAYEAGGQAIFLERASRILDFFVGRIAPAENWRIPEHYTQDWQIDRAYEGNPMFRPAGSTPGHSFELARLLLQLWDLSGRFDTTAPANARRLITRALQDAWQTERGGFIYTLASDGTVLRNARYWWPVTEAIGALACLIKFDAQPEDEIWYRRLWGFADAHLIDHVRGGWYPELSDSNGIAADQFSGKPDIYHALQADLLPLVSDISRSAMALGKAKPLA
ncbi:AGE family epimerase/isomerase [Pseudorhodobacter wandonensis]|uniref:AGE family epimerase/isomerase n=1 Tax=Pseudorhodobacter wandonensis TaxID=1120568 RepID=UPI00067C0868|nr:AGE family epimerase/isomerase [Pseudorhodobacter wandonensis]